MPELRRYTVVQEREVKVSSTDPVNAGLIAARIFSNTKQAKDQVNILSAPREISVQIREDRNAY